MISETEAVLNAHLTQAEQERDRLRARLAESEAIVYGLCDAWDGDVPPDDPNAGGVLFAIWCESAGYHARYRMGQDDNAPCPSCGCLFACAPGCVEHRAEVAAMRARACGEERPS